MSTAEDITAIAKDICLCRVFPGRSNNPKRKPYRKVLINGDEVGHGRLEDPFGFEFHGAPIEVHVHLRMRRVKGTCVFVRVPTLSIFGVLKDGTLHPIAKEVETIQGVVE